MVSWNLYSLHDVPPAQRQLGPEAEVSLRDLLADLFAVALNDELSQFVIVENLVESLTVKFDSKCWRIERYGNSQCLVHDALENCVQRKVHP